jgi:UPF0716 protein FxsA
MVIYLFLLLILLPLAEILILVKIGQATALWVPFAIVIVTGIAGTALARWQGVKVLGRIREEMQAGRMPADSLIDGFLVLVAGALFVLPGVLTDIVGILLLIPQTRLVMKRALQAWIRRSVEVRVGRLGNGFSADFDGEPRSGRDQIIDARVIGTRVEDAKK